MSNLAKVHETENLLPADPMISMIERMVLDPNADIEKLERMLAMKERLDAQNAKVQFATALSQARAEIPPIIKDATVDFTSQKGRTHYRHETLAGIAKQIDPILSKHGLSYRYRTSQDGGQVVVTCIISHSAGYSEETSLAGGADQSGNKNNFQAVGSAVTYLQRYTLKAALGLSAEVDDDAQSVGRGGNQPEIRDDGSAFDANAAADRLIAKFNRAKTLADLGAAWADEARTLNEIKAACPAAFAKTETAKNAAKDRLATANIDAAEIPY